MNSILVFQMLATLLSFTQTTPSNTETFRITKSYLNGRNFSWFDLERGGVLILGMDGGRVNEFKNYSEIDKSQSFGTVQDYKADTVYIKDTKYRIMNASFKWHFKNDYDTASGIALVKLIQKETIYGTDFELKMDVLKLGEVIEYSGYKEGTRSSYILNETIIK